MRVFEPNQIADLTTVPASRQVVTTLYDLIESLNSQVMPCEDDVVIAAMQYIINTRRLTFVDLPHAHRLQCA